MAKEEENRRSRKFKARPLLVADEDWQTIQNRQSVRRKQRKQIRKEMVRNNAEYTTRDRYLMSLLRPELYSLVHFTVSQAREQSLLLLQMSSMSRLPKRMAMHELQRKAVAAGATATDGMQETQTAKMRSYASPETIRQVLFRRQQRWDQQLLAAKRTKKPVVPQV